MDPTAARLVTPALNETFLADGTCFGCGRANPDGLHIRIHRVEGHDDRLVGRYEPRALHAGFPQIVHGGLQFTALDCMAGWVQFVLRQPGRAMPLTTGGTIRYRKPVRVDQALTLSAQITREAAGPRDPLAIHCEIHDAAGDLLTEADFEYVALPLERFLKAVALEAVPDTYRRHFGLA